MKSKIILTIIFTLLFLIKTVNADMITPGMDCISYNESCYSSCVEKYKNSPIYMDGFCKKDCCIKTEGDKARDINSLILISVISLIVLIILLIKLRKRNTINSIENKKETIGTAP